MSRDLEYLVDIIEAAKLALIYVQGKTRESFFSDTQCQDAVIRRLELIGEAARRVSEQTQSALPQIPWKLMIATRNFMIHEYDGIDMGIIWDAVQFDLPPLVAALEKIVPTEGSK